MACISVGLPLPSDPRQKLVFLFENCAESRATKDLELSLRLAATDPWTRGRSEELKRLLQTSDRVSVKLLRRTGPNSTDSTEIKAAADAAGAIAGPEVHRYVDLLRELEKAIKDPKLPALKLSEKKSGSRIDDETENLSGMETGARVMVQDGSALSVTLLKVLGFDKAEVTLVKQQQERGPRFKVREYTDIKYSREKRDNSRGEAVDYIMLERVVPEDIKKQVQGLEGEFKVRVRLVRSRDDKMDVRIACQAVALHVELSVCELEKLGDYKTRLCEVSDEKGESLWKGAAAKINPADTIKLVVDVLYRDTVLKVAQWRKNNKKTSESMLEPRPDPGTT